MRRAASMQAPLAGAVADRVDGCRSGRVEAASAVADPASAKAARRCAAGSASTRAAAPGRRA